MRVEVKTGGDGVRCWNVAAIQSYAQATNEREAQLAQRNPDLTVKPGVVSCYGCEVMEYDYGIKCTARLTRTRDALDVKLNDLRRLFGGQPNPDASPSSFCSFLVSPSAIRLK